MVSHHFSNGAQHRKFNVCLFARNIVFVQFSHFRTDDAATNDLWSDRFACARQILLLLLEGIKRWPVICDTACSLTVTISLSLSRVDGQIPSCTRKSLVVKRRALCACDQAIYVRMGFHGERAQRVSLISFRHKFCDLFGRQGKWANNNNNNNKSNSSNATATNNHAPILSLSLIRGPIVMSDHYADILCIIIWATHHAHHTDTHKACALRYCSRHPHTAQRHPTQRTLRGNLVTRVKFIPDAIRVRFRISAICWALVVVSRLLCMYII